MGDMFDNNQKHLEAAKSENMKQNSMEATLEHSRKEHTQHFNNGYEHLQSATSPSHSSSIDRHRSGYLNIKIK